MIKIYNLVENSFATFDFDGCEFLVDTRKNGFDNYTHNVYVNDGKMDRGAIILKNLDNFSHRGINPIEACSYAVAKLYEDLIKHKVKVNCEHIELLFKDFQEYKIIKYNLTDDTLKPVIENIYKLPLEYKTNNDHQFFIDKNGKFLALKNDIRFATEPYTNYLVDDPSCIFIFGKDNEEIKKKYNEFIDCLKEKNKRHIKDEEEKLSKSIKKYEISNNNLDNQKL